MRRVALILFLLPVQDCWSQSFHTATVKSPDAGTMFIHPERIPLRSGGMFTAERATMFVPLNRSNPDTDVISIDVYKFPRSTKASPDTPPIFILNGGPGFEGLEESLAKPGTFEQQLQPFLDISDIVVVGQRGIGSSRPGTLIEQSTAPQPVDEPWDEDRATTALTDVLTRERDFWLDQGVDLSGFNVLEAAADVRDVSEALGCNKIILRGGSFGSHWGMAIMRRYPEIVERAVLHGMEGPNHTWDHPGWIWNAYKRVAEEAESDEQLKPLIPEGGLIKAIETIVKNARQQPVSVTLNEGTRSERKVLLDGHAMQRLARGYSGELASWPADVMAMHNGDFIKAAQTVLMRSQFRGRDFSTASFWMLDSGSGITAERFAEFEADPARQVIGSTYWHYAAGSPVWQIDLGDEFRQNFETSIPTVIVHGTWDTQTPYENALELAPYFKNSLFITVKRGSHGAISEAMGADRTFRSALMEFFKTGDRSGLPDHLELELKPWVIPAGDDKR